MRALSFMRMQINRYNYENNETNALLLNVPHQFFFIWTDEFYYL